MSVMVIPAPPAPSADPPPPPPPADASDLPPPLEPVIAESHLPYRLDELERWAYARALRVASGNRRQAIQLLGVSPATFYRKARQFGLIGNEDESR